MEPRISSLTHSAIRGTDHFAFQMAAPHPFPTLWSAKDGTLSLFQLLPNEQEIDSYLKAFQRRAQSSSFPHVPEECTKLEVQRFLENAEHNSAVHPDMLALLFTTLALGLQLGVYDKCGEDWKHGAVEAESKQGDVYSEYRPAVFVELLLITTSRCSYASSEACLVHESTNTPCYSNPAHDWSIPDKQWQVP